MIVNNILNVNFNKKTIYLIPKPELKEKPIKVISELVDMPIKFLCEGDDLYDFMRR